MFNIKFITFALTLLAAVGFLNPKGILNYQMVKALFYLLSFCLFGLGCIEGKRLGAVKYPRYCYWVLLGAMFLAVFVATNVHHQPFKVSLMAELGPLMAVLMFWAMMRLDLPEEQILKFLLICCLVAVPVYFVNAATFPNMLFGGETIREEDLSRGILRVPIYFLEFMVMFWFYSINQWIVKRNYKWIGIGALFLVMIFLSVTRQVILISGVLGVVFMLKNAGWFLRICTVGFIAVLMLVILPAIPAYQAMMELSEDQSEQNEMQEEDIRIYDYRYFGDEAQTSIVTRIFGNGVPSYGNSKWGDFIESEWEINGTFAVDVGWIGFYWHYGAIAVIALLILLIKAAMRHKPPEKRYLTYTVVYFILASIASGPILYFHQMLYIMVVLYLIYKPSESEYEQINSGNNIKLQQRRRLGQLREERREIQ